MIAITLKQAGELNAAFRAALGKPEWSGDRSRVAVIADNYEIQKLIGSAQAAEIERRVLPPELLATVPELIALIDCLKAAHEAEAKTARLNAEISRVEEETKSLRAEIVQLEALNHFLVEKERHLSKKSDAFARQIVAGLGQPLPPVSQREHR